MSLLRPKGETLMEWRESNANVRKTFSCGRFVLLLGLMVLILGVFVVIQLYLEPEKHFPFAILLAVPIAFLGGFSAWFSSDAVVCLSEFCVVRSTGKYGSRSDYSEIESCTVRSESYNDKKLSTIEFKLKDKPKFLPISIPVETIVVPEDVNLEQVLQILRDKGVNVVEGPLPS
ncbi:MAG: hypothetical protein ABSC01_09050 [Verrucomicrobiota bacterium]|jgi:hypothetical protein